MIRPAGRYVAMMTPAVVTFEPTSVRPVGCVANPNSRFPKPTTTGNIQSRNSSISSYASRVWIRSQLPCTWSSGPSPAFSLGTAVSISPSIRVELLQSNLSIVLEATCLVAPLRRSATGPSANGQWAAKIS